MQLDLDKFLLNYSLKKLIVNLTHESNVLLEKLQKVWIGLYLLSFFANF
jgi:hypothetical protein